MSVPKWIASRQWLVHLIRILLRHFPILTILLVIGLLLVGTVAHGSIRATVGMLAFISIVGATYVALLGLKSLQPPIASFADMFVLEGSAREFGIWLIGLTAIAIALIHLVLFNGMTLGAVMKANTSIEVALIRQGLTENLPTWMHYLNSIAIKALFPIALLLAVIHRLRTLTLFVAVVGAIYSVCMLQKSGPVILALPTIAYFILSCRWVRLACTVFLVVAVVLLMGVIANPRIQSASLQKTLHSFGQILPDNATRSREDEIFDRISEGEMPAGQSAAGSLIRALFDRVIVVPGDVAAIWFDAIPEVIPYGEGCGYRFLTPLIGCEFQNYSTILYAKLYPEETAQGLRGTVNAASMMTAYANFGMAGIAISAIMHGFLAWVLYILFHRTPALSPPFNGIYLVLLSSGDLFTLMLSGGWGFALIFYITLCRPRYRLAYDQRQEISPTQQPSAIS